MNAKSVYLTLNLSVLGVLKKKYMKNAKCYKNPNSSKHIKQKAK